MDVRTQEELIAAIESGEKYIYCVGSGYFDISNTENSNVTAWENSNVTARGNSNVTAWGNSNVTARGNSNVTAWGNSNVTAWENSNVTAWGNSNVTAWENSNVTAWENSNVTATSWVSVRRLSPLAKIVGGILIEPPILSTPELWCEFYGLEVTDGVAILFKGVDDTFKSSYGTDYSPGLIPVAADWDGGKQECGKGLHFSPHPAMTLEFMPDAKRFLACPVALADMAVHPNGSYPQKCKAKGCCAPTYEVDRNGKRIEVQP